MTWYIDLRYELVQRFEVIRGHAKAKTLTGLALVGSWYQWEWPPHPIWFLIALMAIDWISGTAVGAVKQHINPWRFQRGVVKVLVYLATVGTVYFVSWVAPMGELGAVLPVWTIGFLGLGEGISILRNLDAFALHFGLDVPILRVVARVFDRQQRVILGQFEPVPEATGKERQL